MTRETPFILVVEDHQKILANAIAQLREAGYSVHGVTSAEAGTTFLDETPLPIDLLLVDVRLPGRSGIDFVRRLQEMKKLPPTIVMSGEASIGETVEAIRLGVYDFIEKPFTRERLVQSVRNCLDHVAVRREVAELKTRVRDGDVILGRSPAIVALRERIEKVAATTARVLIRGESGTGKELVANTLHRSSPRRNGTFVKINCAAIPAHLIEDELFGHARGAFTDARDAKAGLFEEAHRGTIFLDEIGDMHLQLQSRLLRVLEDGKVRRIGETHERQVDVRVIAASNRDLQQLVTAGEFREDLYFRLATVPVDVPPLRERAEDIALLFTHFIDVFCRQNQRRRLTIEPETFVALNAHAWPGNVRELRNVCEQLAIFGADPVTPDQLPMSIMSRAASREAGLLRLPEDGLNMTLRELKEQCEREFIESVLRRTNWNFSAAAQMLDIARTYLHHKVTQLGIERP